MSLKQISPFFNYSKWYSILEVQYSKLESKYLLILGSFDTRSCQTTAYSILEKIVFDLPLVSIGGLTFCKLLSSNSICVLAVHYYRFLWYLIEELTEYCHPLTISSFIHDRRTTKESKNKMISSSSSLCNESNHFSLVLETDRHRLNYWKKSLAATRFTL